MSKKAKERKYKKVGFKLFFLKITKFGLMLYSGTTFISLRIGIAVAGNN